MALHLSGKMTAIGLVVVALITAFSAPRERAVPVEVTPIVEVREAPLDIGVQAAPLLHEGPIATPSLVVRATAYNSLESQTNSQPFITATGARTRWGIIAVSRDLLGDTLPYGSLVRLTDLGTYHGGRAAGAYQSLLDGAGYFVVEDTMHPRKTSQVDIWFQDYASAVSWGVRKLEVEVVRYGRDGPLLDGVSASTDGFSVDPLWLASR